MKKYILIISALCCTLFATAQVPEDMLRYGFFPVNGSARNMAIGGAMGSLGGDISALYVNPAGLGLYKTREMVISPGLALYNNKFDYRGTTNSGNHNAFNLGTSGYVFGYNSRGKWTSQAISIGVNTIANFNNTYTYRGTNNFSSMTELFAEQLSSSGLSIDDALNNPRFAFGTAPALYTYLIDTFPRGNSEYEVKGMPQFLLEQGTALQQQTTVNTTGGITELAIGYAANMDDKIYVGGSVGIPIVSYERFTTYREADPTNDATNNFNYFELSDRIKTTGLGFNAKLGVIVKPAERLRLGLALHTPSFYALTDKQSSSLTADTEAYNGVATVSSDVFTNNNGDGKTAYNALTPWRAMISGSYVFNEVNDTRRQRAFITADIEYVGYPNSSFRSSGDNVAFADLQYYQDMKAVIRDFYKGGFNFRLGGELKFNTIMFRLGGAYYSSPYREKELDASIVQATGGLGYRDKGIFIDLGYSHNFLKDVHFPYRLADKANTFATQNGSRGNVVLTFGFKF